jgi:hypothetical protein
MSNPPVVRLAASYAGDKMADDRAVVTLHATECRRCTWRTTFVESDEDRAADADRQTAHARSTGHREFWQYTVQRGQARLYFL